MRWPFSHNVIRFEHSIWVLMQASVLAVRIVSLRAFKFNRTEYSYALGDYRHSNEILITRLHESLSRLEINKVVYVASFVHVCLKRGPRRNILIEKLFSFRYDRWSLSGVVQAMLNKRQHSPLHSIHKIRRPNRVHSTKLHLIFLF